MFKRTVFLAIAFIVISVSLWAQKSKTYTISSPDNEIAVTIEAGAAITWAVSHKTAPVITPSVIAMHLQGGEILGKEVRVRSAKKETVSELIDAINYKKNKIANEYNQLTLTCRGDYGLIFRVFNDGVAYRFFTQKKETITIETEDVNFNFTADHKSYFPYVNDPHNNDIFECSFENNYEYIKISEFKKDTLAFAPVMIELEGGKKAVITEADLENYPGMFLQAGNQHNLVGKFAPYPTEEKRGGHNNLQSFVMKRAGYIAETEGTRNYPWRVLIISEEDKELLNNDMVYKLASPSRLNDISWIKPGKVAWDWWNNWNITGVDFQAGINTATYKYYIDFAAANNIENVLLDEGWADPLDIMKIVPAINLQEIIDYAKHKNIGVWLWGGWLPLDKKTDEALSTYSKMGIKGFKIDFMDRDDQKMVQFYYRFAGKAAEYKLMIDFHGAYKPTGLQRTYPNVVNFEGVRGLENTKWSNTDFPLYDATIPFIRMIAGPMDYTPGAMINANKNNFRSIFANPMSQGTRCHQLAMYVLYEAPFTMLCDNPINYMREPESVRFMASVPTTFDETVALDGKVSEFAAIARRKGSTWYIGVLGNWNTRDITLDCSFLGDGAYEAEIFKDGINADRQASDYKKETVTISSTGKINIHLAPGGGWVATIKRK